jgi:predicted RNA-binding protein YlqC (UPF0109 family)
MKTELSFETSVEEMLRALCLAFIKHGEELSITSKALRDRSVVTILPHIDDKGKLIGTAGVHINALKTLAGALALRHNRKLTLLLENPKGEESADKPRFKADPQWRSEAVAALLKATLLCLFTQVEVTATDPGDATILEAKIGACDVLADLVYEIGDALDVIFKAIGKAQGRNEIFVDLAVLPVSS